MKVFSLAPLALALCLAACGGGGSSAPAPKPTPSLPTPVPPPAGDIQTRAEMVAEEAQATGETGVYLRDGQTAIQRGEGAHTRTLTDYNFGGRRFGSAVVTVVEGGDAVLVQDLRDVPVGLRTQWDVVGTGSRDIASGVYRGAVSGDYGTSISDLTRGAGLIQMDVDAVSGAVSYAGNLDSLTMTGTGVLNANGEFTDGNMRVQGAPGAAGSLAGTGVSGTQLDAIMGTFTARGADGFQMDGGYVANN